MAIEQFQQVRSDGHVIHETMDVTAIFALGEPRKIVELQWRGEAGPVAVSWPGGVLAKVLPNRENVVCIDLTEPKNARTLTVLNADGSVLRSMSISTGHYGWFEPARNSDPDVIGVVVDRGDLEVREVNVISGEIIGSYPTR